MHLNQIAKECGILGVSLMACADCRWTTPAFLHLFRIPPLRMLATLPLHAGKQNAHLRGAITQQPINKDREKETEKTKNGSATANVLEMVNQMGDA